MYKLATGGSNLELYDIFDRPPLAEITRGHLYRIKLDRPTAAAYSGYFLARSVMKWNKLDVSY